MNFGDDDMGKIQSFLFSGEHRKIKLFLIDILIFAAVDVLLLVLEKNYLYPLTSIYFLNFAVLLVCFIACRLSFRIYNNVWRYTNTKAYCFLLISDAVAFALSAVMTMLIGEIYSSFFIGIGHLISVFSLTTLVTLTSRFAYRLVYKKMNQMDNDMQADHQKQPIAIVGAGQLGVHLANELMTSPKSNYTPVCFIEKDQGKINKKIAGIPVVSADDSAVAMRKYGFSEVVIAIVGMNSEKYKALWELYNGLGCQIKVYDSPLHTEDADKNGAKRIIRDFSIEDLLFRKPLDINNQSEFNYYKEKTVLVTGGGGSIGSELCRQIAKCSPKRLIIFDIYENNAYDIQQELTRKYGDALDLCVEIGSVRDPIRLECVFENYRPDIVFHAAAHKHVPLMEHSGAEAIKNNVLGTYNTANMAEKYGVQKFILISTDKAVNPTNIMGASKRLCEMVIQCRTDAQTSFAAVRFGNVLGSNGSVIPLFKRQILAGGPVTITDKRIIRYFMTIPEASQLVMQAGAKAKKGELFVLDMGQPVRIYDLAVNMIKLMGFEPGKDIEINEIGLRPGEKLYEELLMKNEDLQKTDNNMIFIEKDTPYTREEVEEKLAILKKAVEDASHNLGSDVIKDAIKRTVPTFINPEVVNRTAESSDEMKNVNETVTV